ncbi:hypothetical protein ACJMK2_044656 [Sinanodonta woodiana]|uniref:G-protein coupled receptors family 1 profile domain-containing protein n=1 Tax=Sinanodonta woodiana TaxID=1069815 RepID=A0ABD3W0Q1_SINWO
MLNNTTDVLASWPTSNISHPSKVKILEMVAPTALMIDRVISPLWYCLGFIGNIIAVKIWLSRKVRRTNPSAIYFGTLAIVQFIYLVFHVIMELQIAWDVQTYEKPHLCKVFNFLLISPQYLVPLLVLGFTVERYIAVCHPFMKENFCTVTRAKIVIVCFSLCSLVLGSVQTYTWEYNSAISGCTIVNEEFHTIWTWLTESILFFLAPVMVLVINILVIREIRRLSLEGAVRLPNQQTSGTSNVVSTITLLCVSFYFICALLPATIVYALQSAIPQGDFTLPLAEWVNDPIWRNYFKYLTIRKVVEEICLSNYAAYFFIYFLTGVFFRRECVKLFKLRRLLTKSRLNHNGSSDYSLVQSKTMATDVTTPC